MVSENEIAASGGYAFNEELHSRISGHGICRLLRFRRRKIQRIDAIAMFALYLQQFTACGQEMDLSGSLKELLGDRGGRLYHVLAVIEDNEKLSRTDEFDKFQACFVRFQREPHRGPDGPNNKVRIGKAPQVDEIDLAAELRGKGVAGSHGNRGLADAARAKKGDEPLLAKALLNVAQDEVTPDRPAGTRRQAALVPLAWTVDFAVVGTDHGSDKRIAPALYIRDVPVSEFAVSKRLSDRGDVHAEASLLDDDIRPDVINELFLRQHLAGTFSEIDQNIEGPASKWKHDTIALKDSLAARKLERAKLQFSVNAIACHGFPTRILCFSQCRHNRDDASACVRWSTLACCGFRAQLHCKASALHPVTAQELVSNDPTLPSREL
jgi:hypothetical protein